MWKEPAGHQGMVLRTKPAEVKGKAAQEHRGVVLTCFQNQQAGAPLPLAFPQLQLTDPIHCNYITLAVGPFLQLHPSPKPCKINNQDLCWIYCFGKLSGPFKFYDFHLTNGFLQRFLLPLLKGSCCSFQTKWIWVLKTDFNGTAEFF